MACDCLDIADFRFAACTGSRDQLGVSAADAVRACLSPIRPCTDRCDFITRNAVEEYGRLYGIALQKATVDYLGEIYGNLDSLNAKNALIAAGPAIVGLTTFAGAAAIAASVGVGVSTVTGLFGLTIGPSTAAYLVTGALGYGTGAGVITGAGAGISILTGIATFASVVALPVTIVLSALFLTPDVGFIEDRIDAIQFFDAGDANSPIHSSAFRQRVEELCVIDATRLFTTKRVPSGTSSFFQDVPRARPNIAGTFRSTLLSAVRQALTEFAPDNGNFYYGRWTFQGSNIPGTPPSGPLSSSALSANLSKISDAVTNFDSAIDKFLSSNSANVARVISDTEACVEGCYTTTVRNCISAAKTDYDEAIEELREQYCAECPKCTDPTLPSPMRDRDGVCACPDGTQLSESGECCIEAKTKLVPPCAERPCANGCMGCHQRQQDSSFIDPITGETVDSAICVDDPEWEPQPPSGGCTGGREFDGSGCGECRCPTGTELYEDPIIGSYCRELCPPGSERDPDTQLCRPVCGPGQFRNEAGECEDHCDPFETITCPNPTELPTCEDGVWVCAEAPPDTCPDTAPHFYEGECWEQCALLVHLGASQDALVILGCEERPPGPPCPPGEEPLCAGGHDAECVDGEWVCPEDIVICPQSEMPVCEEGQRAECVDDEWVCVDDDPPEFCTCPPGFMCQEDPVTGEEECVLSPCLGCQVPNAAGTGCVDPANCPEGTFRDSQCNCVDCGNECLRWDGTMCVAVVSSDCTECPEGQFFDMTDMECRDIPPPPPPPPEIPTVTIGGITFCPRGYRYNQETEECEFIELEEPPCARRLSIVRDWRNVLNREVDTDYEPEEFECASRARTRPEVPLSRTAHEYLTSGEAGKIATATLWLGAQR